jgi:hypothetical protein
MSKKKRGNLGDVAGGSWLVISGRGARARGERGKKGTLGWGSAFQFGGCRVVGAERGAGWRNHPAEAGC